MKSWTVMIFLAGDNDLEAAGHADLFEMLKVGSSSEVDVVVQFDSRRDGTIRYHVQPESLQSVGEALAETNTGDPAVLTDFIRWARETYPARHTLLVLWNHGTGWEDVPAGFNWQTIRGGSLELKRAIFASTIHQAYSQIGGARAIALDATNRDFLDNNELKRGLAAALDGDKLDVIGFDACLMGMIEIGYQLRNYVHYMVASQELEPHYGWPYDTILGALVVNPGMSPREVSQLIVNSYKQMGLEIRTRTKYTQSALDLSQLDTTFKLVQELTEHFTASYPGQLAIRKAVHEASGQRNGAKRFRDGNSVDFYDWIWHLRRVYHGPEAEFKAKLDKILKHLTPGIVQGPVVATIAELGDDGWDKRERSLVFGGRANEQELDLGDDRERVHGVSIYLPQYKRYSQLYEDLDFAQTGWGAFAKKISETIR